MSAICLCKNPVIKDHPAGQFCDECGGWYKPEHGSIVPTEHTPIRNNIIKNEKIGRNDFCPCGSGKKYKKCCINVNS